MNTLNNNPRNDSQTPHLTSPSRGEEQCAFTDTPLYKLLNITTLLRALIWLYRHTLSYFLGKQCRFQPTCSAYADEALRQHGLLKGSWLAIRRLSRCHPWGSHGYDPVPKKK